MDRPSTYDLPLDALKVGEHDFAYALDDAFFAAYESDLVQGGRFDVKLVVTRVANQFTLDLHVAGEAHVSCDRCLASFELPLDLRDEVIVKFANGAVREEENVIFLPFGTERLDVAKVMFDAIGLALPMKITHDGAGLPCDPSVLNYLARAGAEPDDETTPDDRDAVDIPEDSPWSALRDLRPEASDN